MKNIYYFNNETPNFIISLNMKNRHIYNLTTMELIGNNNRLDSGISHSMLFNRKILDDLLVFIETKFKKPAWIAICDTIIKMIKIYGYNDSILSEFELYYNFSENYNIYNTISNYKFIDISYDKFNFLDKSYNYIADHDYLSRNNNEWKNVNKIDIKKTILDKDVLDNFKIKNIPEKEDLYNQTTKLFDNYNCNISEDRMKIIK